MVIQTTRLLVLLSLPACGIPEELSAWRSQVDASVKTIASSIDTVARAVPGARERELWELVHSADPEVRKHARTLVKQMYGLEPEQALAWEASVWFEIPSGKQLSAAVFSARTHDIAEVQQFIEGRNTGRVAQVGSQVSLVPSPEEVRARMLAKVSDVINMIEGAPFIWPHPDDSNNISVNGLGLVMWPNALIAPTVYKAGPPPIPALTGGVLQQEYNKIRSVLQSHIDHAKNNRELLCTKLVDLLLEPYTSSQIADRTLVVPWNVLGASHFLFVIVPQEEAKSLEFDFAVSSVVHAIDQTEVTYLRLPPTRIGGREFRANPVVEDKLLGVSYVWACANMTNSPAFSSDVIQAREQLRDMLERWNEHK